MKKLTLKLFESCGEFYPTFLARKVNSFFYLLHFNNNYILLYLTAYKQVDLISIYTEFHIFSIFWSFFCFLLTFLSLFSCFCIYHHEIWRYLPYSRYIVTYFIFLGFFSFLGLFNPIFVWLRNIPLQFLHMYNKYYR